MESTAPAHQVALFKSAPRDYLNLGSLKSPYLVSYYIDESFHTTWVVRGRTKFKNLKGEDGLKFYISDYQFSLPKVEAVLISELPEYFKATGPGVDVILGRDFLTAYSFLFFKKSQNCLQLSKSCVNRCVWPNRPDSCINFYTAWNIDEIDKKQAGTAAFVNICSPFSTWRPYKPCFWDPKEDIGLCAIIQAMETATQIPIFHPGPIVNIITNDKYACETLSPFLKLRHGDLGSYKDFQTLKPQLRDIVNRFLEYRKNYADRNNLEELSCVHIINYRKQEHRKLYGIENLEYAVQLAKLGAKMKEFNVKGKLESQLPNGQYYHFDAKKQIFGISKRETNKTLREILQSYTQLTGHQPTNAELSDDEVSVHSSAGGGTSISALAIASEKKPSNQTLNAALNSQEYPQAISDDPAMGILSWGEKPTSAPSLAPENRALVPNLAPNLASAFNTKNHAKHRHVVDFDLKEDLEKAQNRGLPVSGLYSVLDRLNYTKATADEKTAICHEMDTHLKNLVKQAEEKGSENVNSARQNCDAVMAGAYKQRNELTTDTVQAAKHFKGYVLGYLNGSSASRQVAQRPMKEVAHCTNFPTLDLTPIGLPPMGHTRPESSVEKVDPAATHEVTEDVMTVDAQRRLEEHRLAMGKLIGAEKLRQTCPTNDTISSIDCYFTKLGETIEEKEPVIVSDNGKKVGNRFLKVNENDERLKVKAAKSKLASQEAALAARFSAIGPSPNSNRRYKNNQREDNELSQDIRVVQDFSTGNMRVLGGTTWPTKKGRGKLLEVEFDGSTILNEGSMNQIDGPFNSVAELNGISKEFATRHKRSVRANTQTSTKANSHKTPIKLISGNAKSLLNKPSQKTPARYPEGALALANIGGIPGDKHSDDQKRVKLIGDGSDRDKTCQEGTVIISTTLATPENDTTHKRVNGEPGTHTPTTNGVLLLPSISYQQLAATADLSSGVQNIMNKSLGTIHQVMKHCPELRKMLTVASVNDLGVPGISSDLGPTGELRYSLVEDRQVFTLVA